MKKGSIVELLIVIIIIVAIPLISSLIVLDVVEDSKKTVFESTAYRMVDAMKLESIENMIAGNSMYKTYDFSTDKFNIQDFRLKGKGSVDSQGRVAIAIYDDKFCATKTYSEEKITMEKYVEGECILVVEETIYNPGDYLKIKVGSNVEDVHNFYVLKDNGNTITAIMDKNIGKNIEWGNNGDITPTIAETQIIPLKLKWTNATEIRLPKVEELISQTDWYKTLTKKQKENLKSEYYNYFNSINKTDEIKNCNSNKTCKEAFIKAGYGDLLLPDWLIINLYTTGDDTTYAYWTQDLVSTNSFSAWAGHSLSIVFNLHEIDLVLNSGVRAVITIDESNILSYLKR